MSIELRHNDQRLRLSARGASIYEWDPGLGATVLDGYRTAAEHEENNGFRNAVLAPWSNRTASACWDDDGVPRSTLGLTDAEGLHGLVWSRDFEAVSEAAAIELVTEIPNSEAFPGPLRVVVRYDISQPDTLGVDITVRNDANRPIPVGLGWHPYVRVAMEEARLWLPASHMVVTDAKLLPLPGADALVPIPQALLAADRPRPAWVPDGLPEFDLRGSLDTAFAGLPDVPVAYADTGLGYGVSLTMAVSDAEAGTASSNFHIFTGDVLERDPRGALAIEPCTTVANMLNRGEREQAMLAPGRSRTLSVTVRVHR